MRPWWHGFSRSVFSSSSLRFYQWLASVYHHYENSPFLIASCGRDFMRVNKMLRVGKVNKSSNRKSSWVSEHTAHRATANCLIRGAKTSKDHKSHRAEALGSSRTAVVWLARDRCLPVHKGTTPNKKDSVFKWGWMKNEWWKSIRKSPSRNTQGWVVQLDSCQDNFNPYTKRKLQKHRWEKNKKKIPWIETRERFIKERKRQHTHIQRYNPQPREGKLNEGDSTILRNGCRYGGWVETSFGPIEIKCWNQF